MDWIFNCCINKIPNISNYISNNTSDIYFNIAKIEEYHMLNNGINDVYIDLNTKEGKVIVTGNKDNCKYTTIYNKKENGIMRTQSIFKCDINKDDKIKQIKDLYKDGLTQETIGYLLSLSQQTISNYINSN